MIQRIQSVFLSLVVLLSLLLFCIPFKHYEQNNGVILDLTLNPYHHDPEVTDMIYLPFANNLLVIIIAAYALFSYKKRKKQMRLARFLMLTSVAMVCTLVGINYFLHPDLWVTKQYRWPAFIPAICVVLSFLAARFIKKDDDLIRSSDRIR